MHKMYEIYLKLMFLTIYSVAIIYFLYILSVDFNLQYQFVFATHINKWVEIAQSL